MKSTGIVRRVDELGRIVLPIEIRRTLNLKERNQVEIYMEGNSIVLKKHEDSCVFCGSPDEGRSFMGKTICPACARSLAEEP